MTEKKYCDIDIFRRLFGITKSITAREISRNTKKSEKFCGVDIFGRVDFI